MNPESHFSGANSLANCVLAHLTRHGVLAVGDGSSRWKFDIAARLRTPDDADRLELDQMLDAIACP